MTESFSDDDPQPHPVVDDFNFDENYPQRVLQEMTTNGVSGWRVLKHLGVSSDGASLQMTHEITKEEAVMKVALSQAAISQLNYEIKIMRMLMQQDFDEDLTRHVVRLIDAGEFNFEGRTHGYLLMEFLPGNPVSKLATLEGDALISKVCEFGLQLLKALYDLHSVGVLHRDVKPENVGLYKGENLVLYELGRTRFFTYSNGEHREARTPSTAAEAEGEWASLAAEFGNDVGRVDDLWSWLFVMVEWINCRSEVPLAWSPFQKTPHVRFLLKSEFVPANLVLRNCPEEFAKIQFYLRCLDREEAPDYLFLAQTLKDCQDKAEGRGLKEPSAEKRSREVDEKILEDQFVVDEMLHV